ncbi:hypothetical protein C1752_02794 [Acaryochloris thomasi RCC1774]|uniref:Uncharacterized protein n=1 Tax=Acaryochloris thomasi RCC1774 TaxID=1764569 RepID=A0A2W1JQ19_9CYAN|nr:hypothetical protein [Acaryochloris thomasi]PZD72992.1 hypothetical protein C1752_02794 [Acaryochloris thomasi RCC1774]
MGLQTHEKLTIHRLILLSNIGALLWLQNNARFWQLYHEAILQQIKGSHDPDTVMRIVQGLMWLAQTCERMNLTQIRAADLQPSWLATAAQRRLYRLGISICGGSCFGLIVGLIGGLSFGLVGSMAQGVISGLWGGMVGGFCSGITVGLISHSIEDLSFGPLGALSIIRPLPTFRVSGLRLYRTIRHKLARRLLVGFLTGILLGLSRQPLTLLLFVTVSAVISAVLESLFISSPPQRSSRLSGRRRTVSAVLIYAMAALCGTGLCSLLLLAFTQRIPWPHILVMAIPIGFYFWFLSEGIIHLQRLVLRIILWRSGTMPWNIASVLNEATALGLLQRRGTDYSFAHLALQNHWAKAHASGSLRI